MTVPEECKFLPPTIKKYDSVTKVLVLDEWPKDLFLSEWGNSGDIMEFMISRVWEQQGVNSNCIMSPEYYVWMDK